MGIKFKKGNYYIDYRAYGRRIREKIGTSRKLAESVLHKRKLAIAEGRFLDMKKKVVRIRFEDFAKEYLKIHSASKRSYRGDFECIQILNRFFGGRYLHEITTLDIEKFKTERCKEVSHATVNRNLAVLRSMFSRAVEWKKLTENPGKPVKLFKLNNQRLRYLEEDEMKRLLDACTGHTKPMVIVALLTGMRRGEILSLKWTDCDFKRDVIRLVKTKNNETRTIPMNSKVKSTLIRVPKRKNSPYIFCTKTGKPYKDIKTGWWTAIRKCGIIDFRFHDLRHTFASHLVMSGVDLNTVRELLGHKSLDMTLRYSHLSPDHKKRAVDILDKRMDTFWTLSGSYQNLEKVDISQLLDNIKVT
ncbi:MAG: site-specific integrase [Candidatus Omnitrophica bacterium]|nr:site-specific integrase [Candidatus Omnitrophota bacterium]